MGLNCESDPRPESVLVKQKRKQLASAGREAGGITIPDDVDEPVDLLTCQQATQAQVHEALAWEPAAEPEPPARPERVYARIERTPNDAASRLGFSVGASEATSIKVGSRWTIHGFHLGSPQIVGALEVSLGISASCSQRLDVRLFDANGRCVLQLDMVDSRQQFDQVRLGPADYFLAFRSPGPGVACEGGKNVANSRLLSALPERPQLDAILAAPSSEFGDVAVPRCAFASR